MSLWPAYIQRRRLGRVTVPPVSRVDACVSWLRLDPTSIMDPICVHLQLTLDPAHFALDLHQMVLHRLPRATRVVHRYPAQDLVMSRDRALDRAWIVDRGQAAGTQELADGFQHQ